MSMDEKGLMIIEELKDNGRESTKRIADRVRMPRVTVHERIKKMVESGVIKKFTVQIDYGKLDLGTTAFILISFMPATKISQEELAKRISKIRNVFDVHIISGEWDFLVKARARSVEEIGSLVVNRLRKLEGVAKTITCFSFQSIKEAV